MSRHLAPEELLLDYASGALPEAVSLAVAVHLALSPESRRIVADLEALGGSLLDGERPHDLAPGALDEVLARLSAPQATSLPRAQTTGRPSDIAALPSVLRNAIPVGTSWQRTIIGIDEIKVPLESNRHEARLLRIVPGRGIPRHVHEGAEHSVVITGSFHDGLAEYAAGDICIARDLEHTPTATGSEICIALVVLEKPIVLSGPLGRLVNPFRYHRFRR